MNQQRQDNRDEIKRERERDSDDAYAYAMLLT